MSNKALNQLLSKTNPAMREKAERRLREEFSSLKTEDDVIDYLWNEGNDIVKELNNEIKNLTSLEIEENISKAQKDMSSSQGNQARSQEAWGRFQGYAQEKKRRENEAFQDWRKGMLREGEVRREAERQKEAEIAKGKRSAETLRKLAKEQEEKAHERALEAEERAKEMIRNPKARPQIHL